MLTDAFRMSVIVPHSCSAVVVFVDGVSVVVTKETGEGLHGGRRKERNN